MEAPVVMPTQSKMADGNKPEQSRSDFDPVLAEISTAISDTFDTFDHESNKTVDKREISAIVRALGCYPSESQLAEILLEVEEDEPSDFVRFDKFQPVMTKIMTERRYRPSTEEQLVKAFEVLDHECKGHLTREDLAKYLVEEGEPFSTEEIEEMMAAAVDPQKGVVYYRDYVQQLVEEQA